MLPLRRRSAAAPADKDIRTGLAGFHQVRSTGAPLCLAKAEEEASRRFIGKAHGLIFYGNLIPAGIEQPVRADDQHALLRAAEGRRKAGEFFFSHSAGQPLQMHAVLAFLLHGLQGRDARSQDGVHHLLLCHFCRRIFILRHGLEVIGEKALPLWSRFAGLFRLPGFLLCLLTLLRRRFPQSPGRQVVHQRPDAADIVPVHVHPQADIHAVVKSQRHILQNPVVGRQAVPMEPAPVVQFTHAVHRHLQPCKFKFFQQPDVGIQVVAVGDSAQGQAHVPGTLADVPHRRHIFFQQRFPAVQGTAFYLVALVPLLLQRGKDRLHHFRLHLMAQPLLSP